MYLSKIIFILFSFFKAASGQQIQRCHGTSKIDSLTGDVQVIGMFPVRNEFSSELNNNALLWSEAFRYAIKEANKQFNGHDLFRSISYDMCGPEEYDTTTEATLDMLLGTDYFYTYHSPSYGYCHCLTQNFPLALTLGIVGPAISSNAIYVNKLVTFESIPIISYAATSPDLSNSTTYPHFFRTIPSDTFQALFIKDILTKFNWTYISVIGTDNSYGRSGINALKAELKDSDTCIAVEALITEPPMYNQSASVITQLINEPLSNVIVFWGSFHSLQNFLNNSIIQKLHQKIWIISEASGRREWFTTEENKVMGTFLIVNAATVRDLKFEEYFYSLNITDAYYNPWIETFLNKHEVNVTHNSQKTLRNFKKYFDTATVGFVQNAVLAYTQAYLKYAKENVPCDLTESFCKPPPIRNHSHFNENFIKKTSIFKGLHNETTEFDSHGDVKKAWFDLYMLIRKKDITPEFSYVAHWSSRLGFEFVNDTLILEAFEVTSTCSDVCLPGTYPIYNAAKTCCWQCIQCPDSSYKNNKSLTNCQLCPENHVSSPNHLTCIELQMIFIRYNSTSAFIMYTGAAIGIIVALTFITTFICYRETPIVRSSNMKMSLAQMFSHFVLFVSPMLFIEEDSKMKCIIRTYMTGFFFVLIVTITMVKIIHIVKIFKLTYRLTSMEVIQQKTTEVLLVLLVMAIEISVSIIMLKMKPVTINTITDVSQYKMHQYCNVNVHYMVQVGYIILLQLKCGVQAFRGRKLPAKYNEAKYMSFAMFTSTLVMVIAIPLEASLETFNNIQFLLAIIIMVANFLILVIQFGYKIVLILFYPEENTLKVFQQERIESCLTMTDRKLSKISTTSLSIINQNSRYSLTPLTNSRESNLLSTVIRNRHLLNQNNDTSSTSALPINAFYEHIEENDSDVKVSPKYEKRHKMQPTEDTPDIYFENGYAVCEL